MRSTTMLIASLAVAAAACGPMTIQYVPVEPATPAVDPNTEQGERQQEGETDRDPVRDDWEQDKPSIPVDTTPARDPWDPDKPGIPTDQEEQRDWDDADDEPAEPRPDKPDLPVDSTADAPAPPTGGGPNIHPPAPDPRAEDGQRRPPHIQPQRPERPDSTVARPPHIQPQRPERPDSTVARPPHIQPQRPERPDSTARPPHIQPPRPDRPDTTSAPDAEPDDAGAPREIRIPPGHMPRGVACRVWIEGTPPGRQAAPVPCARLHGDVPEGAFILHADRAWDTLYDWVEHEQREPGSVPPPILELMRSL